MFLIYNVFLKKKLIIKIPSFTSGQPSNAFSFSEDKPKDVLNLQCVFEEKAYYKNP